MLQASVLGLNYCRRLEGNFSKESAEALAAAFDYVFVVCYDACEASSFETIQKNACLIDLSRGVDAAFSKFHATSRNEVRRTEKMTSLSFQTGFNDDFDAYFNFYKACENVRGWFPVPEEELRNSLVITAFFEGKPIAGMSAYTQESRLRIGRIYSLKNNNRDERLNNLVFGCSSKRIVYEFCQYGVANGFHTLDLGGLDLNDPAKAGITRFKRSLGGQITPVTIARHASATFIAREPAIRAAGYDIT